MLFDTHAHYENKAFDADRDEVIASLPGAGVALAANIGCDVSSSRMSAELACRYEHIYAAAGVHPHEAEKMTDDDLVAVAGLFENKKVRALGEIGLDYHYDFSPRDIQRRRFTEQMELARSLGVPVIIHEREATRDCLEIVRAFPGVTGVFHCFSGSVETAKEILSLGYYISFTGIVTFANARRAHEVVRMMPRDRLMIETDCPYMAPVPYRGRRNSSHYLIKTAEKVAELRGISTEEAAALTLENGKRFYAIA